eukprot:NODE_1857_length_1047_cov_311.704637.p1 GENE.NODE_1857_length_1047_cov_311.704637~~NODE_1857_length_1047_cov_311.704637.p1  ORF type:complete len:286 (+),score=63.37 NODE_1857_length_1047_cov_311.704637:3-860(+)
MGGSSPLVQNAPPHCAGACPLRPCCSGAPRMISKRTGAMTGAAVAGLGFFFWKSNEARHAPPRILILGKPGSGKGMQCRQLLERYKPAPHITMGGILRAEVQKCTPIGRDINAHIKAKTQIPREIGLEVLRARLDEKDCKECGWLGDGWTRDGPQADTLVKAGIIPDCIIDLEVPWGSLIERLQTGQSCTATGEGYYHVSEMPNDLAISGKMTMEQPKDRKVLANILKESEIGHEGMIKSWSRAGVPLFHIDACGSPETVNKRIVEQLDAHYAAAKAKKKKWFLF